MTFKNTPEYKHRKKDRDLLVAEIDLPTPYMARNGAISLAPGAQIPTLRHFWIDYASMCKNNYNPKLLEYVEPVYNTLQNLFVSPIDGSKEKTYCIVLPSKRTEACLPYYVPNLDMQVQTACINTSHLYNKTKPHGIWGKTSQEWEDIQHCLPCTYLVQGRAKKHMNPYTSSELFNDQTHVYILAPHFLSCFKDIRYTGATISGNVTNTYSSTIRGFLEKVSYGYFSRPPKRGVASFVAQPQEKTLHQVNTLMYTALNVLNMHIIACLSLGQSQLISAPETNDEAPHLPVSSGLLAKIILQTLLSFYEKRNQ